MPFAARLFCKWNHNVDQQTDPSRQAPAEMQVGQSIALQAATSQKRVAEQQQSQHHGGCEHQHSQPHRAADHVLRQGAAQRDDNQRSKRQECYPQLVPRRR